MATVSDWTDRYSQSYLGIDDNTYNRKVILDSDGLEKLVTYLEVGQFPDSIFINATDWISGITYFPINIPQNEKRWLLKIGAFSTEVPCGAFYSPYQYLIDLGYLDVQPHFYNFADFNGYTKIQCWLPYYGLVDLLPNDVMGKRLHFRLAVDYNTGNCLYYICVSDTTDTTVRNARIIATVQCQIGFMLPFGTSGLVDVIRNVSLQTVRTAASLAKTGLSIAVAGAAGATHTVTSHTTKSAKSTHRNPSTGRQQTQSTYTIQESVDRTETYDNSGRLAVEAANTVYQNSMSALEQMHLTAQSDRPNNINLLRNGSRSIKLVIYRPRIKDAISDYKHLVGKPLGIVANLGELSGYTELSFFHLENEDFSTATQDEINMLKSELLGGILL